MQARLTQFTPSAYEGSPTAMTSPHMSLGVGDKQPSNDQRNANPLLPKNLGGSNLPTEISHVDIANGQLQKESLSAMPVQSSVMSA